ncbi:MAG: hypothetical protein J1F39_04835, partial [Clostridiales bacterium]|nr:hypothetical protein [Clostridiales bacterium]
MKNPKRNFRFGYYLAERVGLVWFCKQNHRARNHRLLAHRMATNIPRAYLLYAMRPHGFEPLFLFFFKSKRTHKGYVLIWR